MSTSERTRRPGPAPELQPSSSLPVPVELPDPPRTLAESSNAEQASLLSAEQLATRWQVPKAHVYRLAREGFLPTVRLGRYMRWRPEAIDAFEREGGAANE